MAKVSLRAYNREIEAMIDRGHLDEAIAHCQHILKTYPKHLETYRLLGKSYLEAKRHNEAVDIFSRVLVAETNDFVAQVGMSIIRDEQNKLDDAIWHMERAFESQPSNAAIQGELQRLYGRRDGSQPPRVRMTRGALAHMYMQGELYPQAISETKSVLEEDQGRTDMLALLAKAYFKSGQKNDAADAASVVLKRYPYCLDANRVLTEILSVDRPESAEVYRKRVFELDPYAAQADGSVFLSNEVSDAAVMVEQLDWNGQSTGMPSDWGSTRAIGLESGTPEQQPDWLKNAFPEETTAPPSAPAFVSDQGTGSLSEADSPAEPAEDIPDFLKAAGWGESTGTFDESASSAMFDETPAADAQPLEQAEMPDWVKAMAPQDETESSQEQEEEIPDWINKIGTGELPVPSVGSSSDEGLDFLRQLGSESSAPETQSAESADNLDFPKTLNDDEPEQPESVVASSEERSVMSETGNLGKSDEERDDSFNWLENLAAKQGATEGLLTNPEDRLEEEPDWIKQAKELNQEEAQSTVKEQEPEPVAQVPSSANVEELGKSDEERDDSFNWLENLAAKQGATEGLLTNPEDRLEDEPEWVKQAKSSGAAEQPPEKKPVPTEEPESTQEDEEWMRNAKEVGEKFFDDSMGTTEQETDEPAKTVTPVDDVSSWLEGLDKEESAQETAPIADLSEDTGAWLRTLDQPEETPVESESTVPENDATESSDDLPSWLGGLDEEKSEAPAVPASDGLSTWMRDDTGELVAEPTKIEPTQPTDWTPAKHAQAEEKEAAPSPAPEIKLEPTPEPEPEMKSASQKKQAKSTSPTEHYKEPVTRKTTGTLEMPVDPILGSARSELSRSNIPGALEAYGKLIKKGRFLEEVIYDLRDALYRYPVEVSIWQSLGDAYMRANQLQEALDAYTKAEELLR